MPASAAPPTGLSGQTPPPVHEIVAEPCAVAQGVIEEENHKGSSSIIPKQHFSNLLPKKGRRFHGGSTSNLMDRPIPLTILTVDGKSIKASHLLTSCGLNLEAHAYMESGAKHISSHGKNSQPHGGLGQTRQAGDVNVRAPCWLEGRRVPDVGNGQFRQAGVGEPATADTVQYKRINEGASSSDLTDCPTPLTIPADQVHPERKRKQKKRREKGAVLLPAGEIVHQGSTQRQRLDKACDVGCSWWRMGTEFGYISDEMLQQLGSPIEFQLPDWLLKQKMTSYTFIKRNIYRTKKIKTRAEDDGIFCSCKPSPGTSVVCDRDCLCGMLLSSCSQSCDCGDLCLNKPFQHRPVKEMRLVQTEKCGSGILADEDIKQGEFVIEYVGEVIDDKTCEDRLWQMKHRGETNFYLCEINRDMVIDATFKGNKSRYINHSCQPNTEMQKWIIDGETRIGIFATRDIKKGEDLTYDYQFVQFGADQDCFCGSVHCRRKLGNKPSKSKPSSSDIQFGTLLYGGDALVSGRYKPGSSYLLSSYRRHFPFTNCINRVIKVWSSRNRRYYGGVISEFDSHSKKHTILKEDGEYEVLDLSMEDWELLDEVP